MRAYLESLGVMFASLETKGKGKCDPVRKDCSNTASREQQIVCLQADRRVMIEVTGISR